MTLSTLVNTITLITLVAGVIFALVQLRQYGQAREREAALEFLRSFQSPQMATALRHVFELPSGLSGEEIEAALAGKMDLIYGLVTTSRWSCGCGRLRGGRRSRSGSSGSRSA